uniref:Uncharacterized protein n=1 Tax=Panagrolaimus sp. JU765 TaxID=591449 RepID=A0AC34R9J2_9BILA
MIYKFFDWRFGKADNSLYCTGPECNFVIPDGGGTIYLSGTFKGELFEANLLGDVVYYNGTISSKNGGVFTEDSPCFQYYDPPNYYDNFTRPYKYCCNRWKMLPDPEPVNDTCLQFTSTINVFKDNKTIAEMEYIYDFSKGTNVTINATKQLTINYDNKFYFGQEFNFNTFFCNSAHQLCSYWVNKTWDSRYTFTIYADTNDEKSVQFFLVAGVIEHRNGTVLKNESSPFTPSDSCTYYTQQSTNINNGYGSIVDAGVTSTTSFCCSLWKRSQLQ